VKRAERPAMPQSVLQDLAKIRKDKEPEIPEVQKIPEPIIEK
jgi:hypothetical protein